MPETAGRPAWPGGGAGRLWRRWRDRWRAGSGGAGFGDGPAAPAGDGARGLILAGVALVAAFFVGLGGWAAVVRIDSAVVAAGVVAVEGERVPIQHRDGGIVREILIREGSFVRAGDMLLRLDDTELRASRDVLARQLDALLAREARLLAERAEAAEVVFPERMTARAARESRLAALLAEERGLFQVRGIAFQGELDLYRQKIAQYREHAAGAEAQKEARRRQLAVTLEEFGGQKDLYDKGFAKRSRIFELERARASLEGAVAEAAASLGQAREMIRTTEQEMLQFRKRRAEEVAGALTETQQKIAELGPRLAAVEEQLARTTLTAPEDGTIMGLNLVSVGNILRPGEKVADVVPAGSSLTVDTQVHPEDIEDLHLDMRAELRLLAFKDMILPEIDGTVTRISPDRVVDPRTGQGYYAVRITVADPEQLSGLNVRLQPGMPVSVLIPTGARTVLDYLVWPVQQQLRNAFREK